MTQTTTTKPRKPLGRRAYGSIGHLPGSRLGPGDHHVPEGQGRICTERTRDGHRSPGIAGERLSGIAPRYLTKMLTLV